jgi:hypothetical protein
MGDWSTIKACFREVPVSRRCKTFASPIGPSRYEEPRSNRSTVSRRPGTLPSSCSSHNSAAGLFLLSLGVLLAILFLNSRFVVARTLTISLYGAIALGAALKLVFHCAAQNLLWTRCPQHPLLTERPRTGLVLFLSLIAGIISKRTQSRSFRWLGGLPPYRSF